MASTVPSPTSNPPRSTLRTRLAVAAALAGAFGLSAAYCGVLGALDKLPSGLAADEPRLWAYHLLGAGTVGLALLDRSWARWLVGAAAVAFLLVGVRTYPALLAPGLLTTLGWFVDDVHVGLLALAGYLTGRHLYRHRTRTPSPPRPAHPRSRPRCANGTFART